MAVESSLRFAALLLLFHGLASVAVYATDMPTAAKLMLFPLILLSLFCYLVRDALLLFPHSWRNISLDQDGVTVVARDGSSFSGRVAGSTVVTPYFIVLRVGVEGRRRLSSRVIFPDALGDGAFRELRVRLKFRTPLEIHFCGMKCKEPHSERRDISDG